MATDMDAMVIGSAVVDKAAQASRADHRAA